VFLAPLVALALAGGGAGSYFWVTSGGGEEEVVAQPTPTEAPTLTPTAEPTATPKPSPVVPADWLTYVDPVLSFSLRYPPDLVATDVTGPASAGGVNVRAIEFRSAEDPSRAFGISVSENTKGLTLEQWAIEYAACQPKSIQQGTFGGSQAILCTREVIEGRPHPAALGENADRIFLISGNLTDSEFSQLRTSFGF